MAGNVEPTASIGVAPSARMPGVVSTAPPTPNMPDRIPDANPTTMTAVATSGLTPTVWAAAPAMSHCGGERLLAARRHAPADAPDALDVAHHRLTGLLGLRREAVDRFDVPVAEHDGHEDLLVVRREVVDAGLGDRAGVIREVDDPDARHLEIAYLTFERDHRRRRIHFEGGGHQVAV